MAKEAIILNVFGKVQGVGFRFYTQKKAIELQISGFVKNMADGSVYIEAEGESLQLLEFISWCEIGPSWARVSKIDKQDIPPTNYTDFRVK